MFVLIPFTILISNFCFGLKHHCFSTLLSICHEKGRRKPGGFETGWCTSASVLYCNTVVADMKIVPSRSLPMNPVLPHRNKQHLILLTDSVKLNGKLHLGGRTGNNAGCWRVGV
jgi:hypothetical protein